MQKATLWKSKEKLGIEVRQSAKARPIDAMFVTVELHGDSNKPAGRPLLFASLRIQPNHP